MASVVTTAPITSGKEANCLTSQSDNAYAEGEGLVGGRSGEWLKFKVYSNNAVNISMIRLFISSSDDNFKLSLFIGAGNDERDMLRSNPSCIQNKFIDNHNINRLFNWDVCYSSNNLYNIRYKVLIKGRFLLHVRLDGNDIPGSPFSIYISDGKPSPYTTRIVTHDLMESKCMPFINEVMDIINDDRWKSTDSQSDFYIKKTQVIKRLEKFSYINKLSLNICDVNGDPITIGIPYIKVWATGCKILTLEDNNVGVITIKYIIPLHKNEVKSLTPHNSPSKFIQSDNPYRINVQINGIHVHGSPFIPIITNRDETLKYYQDTFKETSRINNEIQTLLDKDEIMGNNGEILSGNSYFPQFNSDSNGANSQDKSSINTLYSAQLESRLLELSKDNNFLSSLMYKYDNISSYNLGKLHEYIDGKYQEMLEDKTSGILNCIRELNSFNNITNDGGRNGFNNLGDVILNYKRLSDELRKLHRYDLAAKFDKINDLICEEIELGRWDEVISYKEDKVAESRRTITQALKKLDEFTKAITNKYEGKSSAQTSRDTSHPSSEKGGDGDASTTNRSSSLHASNITLGTAVQTVGDECVSGRLLPLVKSRCGGKMDESYKIESLVDMYWRRCSNYEIQTSISKLLKSMVRLKNVLKELFYYYGREYKCSDGVARYGIDGDSTYLFNIQCKLNGNLLDNKKRLSALFDKCSIVINNNQRIIIENMWCVYIRELSYLNLIYIIIESGNFTLLRENHPTRLMSFNHFCNHHLLALYEYLYVNIPEFQRYIRYPTKLTSGNIYKYHKETLYHYFPTIGELKNFINSSGTLEYILSHLNEAILKALFQHYSNASMKREGSEMKDNDARRASRVSSMNTDVYHSTKTSSTTYDTRNSRKNSLINADTTARWVSTSMFVVFARDFSIIPGHIDGGMVQNIASDIASSQGRLYINDFIDALVNVISNCIYKLCAEKHALYNKIVNEQIYQKDFHNKKLQDMRQCIQSQESVYQDIKDLINIIGLNDTNRATITIDAIYGPEALEEFNLK